jgi:hypothetical protein
MFGYLAISKIGIKSITFLSSKRYNGKRKKSIQQKVGKM